MNQRERQSREENKLEEKKEETDGGQILFIIPSEMELGREFMKSGIFQTVSSK